MRLFWYPLLIGTSLSAPGPLHVSASKIKPSGYMEVVLEIREIVFGVTLIIMFDFFQFSIALVQEQRK